MISTAYPLYIDLYVAQIETFYFGPIKLIIYYRAKKKSAYSFDPEPIDLSNSEEAIVVYVSFC